MNKKQGELLGSLIELAGYLILMNSVNAKLGLAICLIILGNKIYYVVSQNDNI